MATAAIEERFIAAIVKDERRWSECRAFPSIIFDVPDFRRSWEKIAVAPTYVDAAALPEARRFWAHPTLGMEYDGASGDRWTMLLVLAQKRGPAGLEEVLRLAPTSTEARDAIRARLRERRYNHLSRPPEPEPRFFIKGRPVCTPGNLTNLIAQAKAGKSAYVGAMIAAAVIADLELCERDTLGVVSSPPRGKRLIHLDTEQSRFDHDGGIRRVLKRAGTTECPDFLYSIGLAGFSSSELRASLDIALQEAGTAGVHALIIDGTADLVDDVNDPGECNAFVARLHDLAIRHDCAIINVVHENPGQDGGKMRGHLGSQLERKAESNLRLKKSEDVTVVFSEKMRRAPISEADGPRFSWSDESGMHVSVESQRISKAAAKTAELAQDLSDALGANRLTYSDLVQQLCRNLGMSRASAERRVKSARGLNLLRCTSGLYELVPSTLN